ncbi:MAG: TRAP transporter small permease, partial [Polaromonas sp.]
MKNFERLFLFTNRWVLIVMLATMALIIFTNVCLRYLTSESIEWAEEVARHLMIWLTFLGCGPVLRYGGHIAVDNLQ